VTTSGYALGVDLGTSYSAAGIARDGTAAAFDLGSRAAPVPSIVSIRKDGQVLVGEPAERRAFTDPVRTAREFKRRMGDPTPIVLGGTPFPAEALQARLLSAIVAQVTATEGDPPATIALCHPAAYSPFKRDLLLDAARLADVEDVRLISEPEAAAVFYDSRQKIAPGEVVAVYDFGGGTFDASVLRNTGAGFELLGTPEGIERLGGVDVDHAVLAHVNEATGGAATALDTGDPEGLAMLARLREDCRLAKEALSTDSDTDIAVALPSLRTVVRLTRAELEAMVRPRLDETIRVLCRSVHSAGLELADVSRILLVGGSTRMPLVAEVVARETGRPVAVDASPKLAVALGAAIWAQRADTDTGTSAVAAALRPAAATPIAAPPGDADDTRKSRVPLLVGAAVLAIGLVLGVVMLGGSGGSGGPREASAAGSEQRPGPGQVASPPAAGSTPTADTAQPVSVPQPPGTNVVQYSVLSSSVLPGIQPGHKVDFYNGPKLLVAGVTIMSLGEEQDILGIRSRSLTVAAVPADMQKLVTVPPKDRSMAKAAE
jgi:molecular chaperone DnaK (HSP70)